MFNLRDLALLLFLLFLTGCASSAGKRQVLYSQTDRNNSDLSFFMDRVGDLYPPSVVGVDDREMVALRDASDFATLRATYRTKAAQPDSSEWRRFLDVVGVSATESFDEDWIQAQNALQQALADRITAAARGMDDVVLLIHGFNNTYAEASEWYSLVEEDVSRYAAENGRRAAFVRMYWNGLTGSPPAIWTAAQANGPNVGLELRRLFNRLDKDIPLRVFTHSSGAFVMTNALGDGSSAFPRAGEVYLTRAAGGDGYDIPQQRDLRMAMLVPAQPLSAYGEFIRDEESFGLVPDRVVLGTSRRDFATGKTRLFTPCWIYGVTCMATKPRRACERVWGDLDKEPVIIDFTQPFLISHPHAVAAYMTDPEWPDFIRALLDDQPINLRGEFQCSQKIRSRKRDRSNASLADRFQTWAMLG